MVKHEKDYEDAVSLAAQALADKVDGDIMAGSTVKVIDKKPPKFKIIRCPVRGWLEVDA